MNNRGLSLFSYCQAKEIFRSLLGLQPDPAPVVVKLTTHCEGGGGHDGGFKRIEDGPSHDRADPNPPVSDWFVRICYVESQTRKSWPRSDPFGDTRSKWLTVHNCLRRAVNTSG